jgi:hypothetical protein
MEKDISFSMYILIFQKALFIRYRLSCFCYQSILHCWKKNNLQWYFFLYIYSLLYNKQIMNLTIYISIKARTYSFFCIDLCFNFKHGWILTYYYHSCIDRLGFYFDCTSSTYVLGIGDLGSIRLNLIFMFSWSINTMSRTLWRVQCMWYSMPDYLWRYSHPKCSKTMHTSLCSRLFLSKRFCTWKWRTKQSLCRDWSLSLEGLIHKTLQYFWISPLLFLLILSY